LGFRFQKKLTVRKLKFRRKFGPQFRFIFSKKEGIG
jgi:hypothetical protein